MHQSSKIYVAGHTGLVGSAIVSRLSASGYSNLILRTHDELDLTNQQAVSIFFADTRPDYVLVAAARVGGILANQNYPAEFIYQNLAIQTNLIHQSYETKVKRLLFLGSSCIYPKLAPQPIKEDALLTGPLENTNRPYAVAKIAGIEMCWSYNRQYATSFVAAMPTNLYGPNDNYDPEQSHLIPALMQRIHSAKISSIREVAVWGTGKVRREFLHSQDAADACIFLLSLPEEQFRSLLLGRAPIINVGCGFDLTVRDVAELLADVIGYQGILTFDPSRPDGTPRKLLDTTLLQSLGWKPTITLREGLQHTYEEFVQRFASCAAI